MALLKNRALMFGIAIFFAMLQVLQPFIHAHLDTNHPVQTSGFHVAADDEVFFSAPNIHGVYFAAHAAHIVSVDEAIKQESDAALNVHLIHLAVLAVILSAVLLLTKPRFPQARIFQYQSFRRYRPATRAPPQS